MSYANAWRAIARQVHVYRIPRPPPAKINNNEQNAGGGGPSVMPSGERDGSGVTMFPYETFEPQMIVLAPGEVEPVISFPLSSGQDDAALNSQRKRIRNDDRPRNLESEHQDLGGLRRDPVPLPGAGPPSHNSGSFIPLRPGTGTAGAARFFSTGSSRGNLISNTEHMKPVWRENISFVKDGMSNGPSTVTAVPRAGKSFSAEQRLSVYIPVEGDTVMHSVEDDSAKQSRLSATPKDEDPRIGDMWSVEKTQSAAMAMRLGAGLSGFISSKSPAASPKSSGFFPFSVYPTSPSWKKSFNFNNADGGDMSAIKLIERMKNKELQGEDADVLGSILKYQRPHSEPVGFSQSPVRDRDVEYDVDMDDALDGSLRKLSITANPEDVKRALEKMRKKEEGEESEHVEKCPTPFLSSSNVEMDDFDLPRFRSTPTTTIEKGLRGRNWTKEFQDTLCVPDHVERGLRIHQLSQDFATEAKRVGKIIIKERNLAAMEKSIKPMSDIFNISDSDLGNAGGEKFLHNCIFFKYAIDSHGLFGEDDKYAMKVAGHELKGLTAYASCGMLLGMSFGLMCLIDYRGFRLIATSQLPISRKTLVYGSADGGNTVYAHNEKMNDIIRNCNNILNLKGHVAGVGPQPKFIYGPCDQEGHVGTDGHFYVLDLSRVFPPETPDPSKKGSFMYRLLRPELVARYPVPLSSDAFTYFGVSGRRKVHDGEVRSASKWMHDEIIPRVAKELPERFAKVVGHTNDFVWLVNQLHQEGINLRHLGRVFKSTEDAAMKKMLLTEMVARALKHQLRAQMRTVHSAEETAYENLVCEFFSTVFGDGFESQYLWDATLLADLEEGFAFEKPSYRFSLRRSLDMGTLFQRLQQVVGVEFRPMKRKDLSEPSAFSSDTLVEIKVCVKMMYAVSRIEADSMLAVASQKTGEEREKYLQVAHSIYESVLSLKPDDVDVLTNMASVLVDMAMMKEQCKNSALVESYFTNAFEYFSASVRLRGKNSPDEKTLLLWGEGLCKNAMCLIQRLQHQEDPLLLRSAASLLQEAREILAGIVARKTGPEHRLHTSQCSRMAAQLDELRLSSEMGMSHGRGSTSMDDAESPCCAKDDDAAASLSTLLRDVAGQLTHLSA